MVFSSIQFIFLFLPVVLSIYLLVFHASRWLGWPRSAIHASNFIILLSSLLFYFLGEGRLIVIMIVSALTDYVACLLIARAFRPGPVSMLPATGPRERWQTVILVVALAINLGLLFFFKYFNFAVAELTHLANLLHIPAWRLEGLARVTLPLGISFYTFQSMSYTIDVYRGEARATRNLVDFGSYHTLFPQLVAGPIVRYVDVAAALAERTIRLDRFVSGIRRFVMGLVRKVLIANTIAVPVDKIFALPADEVSVALAWIAVVGYALQIYYDFAGYSDMAIGLGRMLGFEFLENFAHPYSSRSLREFWRRWHISLSTWFRDYLYIPLGGNRGGHFRTSMNLLMVFLLCGLWHGAEWTFVAWGLWHGIFLMLERIRGVDGWLARHRLASHVYTLALVLVGWVLFRAASFPHAAAMLRTLVGFPVEGGVPDGALRYFTPDVACAFVLGCVFSFPVGPALWARWNRYVESASSWRVPLRALTSAVTFSGLALLAFFCVCALSASTYNPFIYFRF